MTTESDECMAGKVVRRCSFPYVIFLAAVIAVTVAMAAAPSARAAERGIADNRLEYHGGIDLTPVSEFAAEMGPGGLNAKWTRVFAYWDQLMPYKPGDPRWSRVDVAPRDGFADAYVHELETVVKALHSQGMSVILSGSDAPAWTWDTRYKRYWSKNETQNLVRAGDAKVIGAFQKYAGFLAGHFAGEPYGVSRFEVWNEPNMRLVPQVVGKAPVGPEAYRRMLIAFSKGAHQANRNAVVIAGATSRAGSSGTSSTNLTSPQWFAGYLKSHGARKWFDAYSHHPYSTKGSSPKPSVPPGNPSTAVTLGNLTALLKIFPRTDFYLTEYCLAVKTVGRSFVVVVNKADQARYLREAYALLSKPQFRRVKTMLWYQVRDWQAHPAMAAKSPGLYTGLVDWTGQRRPAWYAFAGGNQITITRSGTAGTTFSLSGALTARGVGIPGQPLVLQRRSLTGTRWATYKTAPTGAGGAYSFDVSQSAAMRYRVIWDGVCESQPVTVN